MRKFLKYFLIITLITFVIGMAILFISLYISMSK